MSLWTPYENLTVWLFKRCYFWNIHVSSANNAGHYSHLVSWYDGEITVDPWNLRIWHLWLSLLLSYSKDTWPVEVCRFVEVWLWIVLLCTRCWRQWTGEEWSWLAATFSSWLCSHLICISLWCSQKPEMWMSSFYKWWSRGGYMLESSLGIWRS